MSCRFLIRNGQNIIFHTEKAKYRMFIYYYVLSISARYSTYPRPQRRGHEAKGIDLFRAGAYQLKGGVSICSSAGLISWALETPLGGSVGHFSIKTTFGGNNLETDSNT